MMKLNKKIGLTLLLILVGLYLFGVALFFDPTFIFSSFLTWGGNIAIATVIVGPFVWLMNRKKGRKEAQQSYSLLGLVALIFLIYTLLTSSGAPLNDLFQLEWNWIGKLIAFFVGVATIALWPGISWKEVGVTAPRKGSWLQVFKFLAPIFAFILIASVLLTVFFNQQSLDMTLDQRGTNMIVETFLFYAIIPGLEEELIFRGLLWVLVAQALPGSTRLSGVEVGWNFLIVTLIFATFHGVTFDANLNFVFDPLYIILAGIGGIYFGLIRNYSGSLIPAIIFHNCFHLMTYIIPWLVPIILN